jgi:hypothetical protein
MMKEWIKQDHVFIMNDTKKKTHIHAPHVVGHGLILATRYQELLAIKNEIKILFFFKKKIIIRLNSLSEYYISQISSTLLMCCCELTHFL